MGRLSNIEASAIRSALFVPGDRPERFAKALASGADAVILDLEDAVASAAKAAARVAITAFLDTAPRGRILVRINAAGTTYFADDLALAQHPQVSAIMLPKTESAEAVTSVSWFGVPVWAQVESAKGIAALPHVAVAPGCQRLVLGVLDLALDLNLDAAGSGGKAALDAARFAMIVASRAADICAPMDSVFLDINDEAGLEAMAAHARSFGLHGMLAIHPKQVAGIHKVFGVSEAEGQWARRVLDAASSAGNGVFTLDGKMVDEPVLMKARRIIDQAGAKLHPEG